MIKPRISHYRHTGRYQEREHTSYSALIFMVLIAGIILTMFSQKAYADPPPGSQSDVIRVTAIVPELVPTNPVVITSPVSGQEFTKNPILVTGTCNKAFVVEVFTNDLLAGSTKCSSQGYFSLTITLVLGRNALTAKQYNLSGSASPPSNTVIVFLKLAKGIDPLILRSDVAFKDLAPDEEFTWPASISGGKGPYAISWEWGDGTIDLISRSEPGSFQLKHRYAKPGQYKIVVRATDALKQEAYLELSATVRGYIGTVGTQRNLFDGGVLLVLWPLYVLLLLMMLSFWLGEKYEKWALRADGQLVEPPPNS